ncbi:V-type ATP synthase subunit I domain-containing protein [Saccharolobus islandicus]|uniref:Uncharacterized protein n=1 Tax=Saccharolobus islandicus (strain M.16.27) TaxID=427318 RepID=C3N610_SACI3|nr:hypothetical protein [Sulfolobus islandicus]ACP55435.1 hypothetical protein M1627_1551 [Sulfolobus islandicus M.16.27]
MDRKRKLKLIKRIWLTLFIILIINNVVADTIAFAQPAPGPNPFYQYLPELIPLGYLLAGILFVLGIIAYRKDFSYAILLISAAALVAALLNYSIGNTAGTNPEVLKVVPVIVTITVTYNGQVVASYIGSGNNPNEPNIGSFEAPIGQNFNVYVSTNPPVKISQFLFYEGDTIFFNYSGQSSYNYTFQTSEYFAGTNTIIVEVSDVVNNTLYYGYGYVEFRYVPTAGIIYQDVMDALMVVSGINAFVLGEGTQFLSGTISDAINNFITTPTIGGAGASNDAFNFFNYFQEIALAIGFVLIALGIGINAIKGGYGDIADLGMDFFYRSGVFLLFAYGGIQIFNAIANSLNMISQYIVSGVLGQISNILAIWTEIAAGLLVGANFIGFGFGRTLADVAMLIFEVDITIFSISYIRIVLIYTLASLIPLIAALWTFEWTRGIATALTEILAGLVFGGLVDALILYFLVQVGGLAFFAFAPAAIIVFIMTGWGAHQVVKSSGSSVASRVTPSYSQSTSSSSSSSSGQQAQKPQNVPIQQILTASQHQQSPAKSQIPSSQIPQQTAIQQLGGISTIRLNNGSKYATISSVKGGYQITKGIRTSSGAVEKTYRIPAYVPITQVAQGVQKNFIKKNNTEIDPELIGQFFKSIESNNINSENVKLSNVRT